MWWSYKTWWRVSYSIDWIACELFLSHQSWPNKRTREFSFFKLRFRPLSSGSLQTILSFCFLFPPTYHFLSKTLWKGFHCLSPFSKKRKTTSEASGFSHISSGNVTWYQPIFAAALYSPSFHWEVLFHSLCSSSSSFLLFTPLLSNSIFQQRMFEEKRENEVWSVDLWRIEIKEDFGCGGVPIRWVPLLSGAHRCFF